MKGKERMHIRAKNETMRMKGIHGHQRLKQKPSSRRLLCNKGGRVQTTNRQKPKHTLRHGMA